MRNLIGLQFGRLVVIHEILDRGSRRNRLFLCICECGVDSVVQFGNLVSGHTTSCGCFALARRRIHGHTSRQGKSRVYRIWQAMVARCHTPSNSSYPEYGGRGIRVCERWKSGSDGQTGFECFLADMGAPNAMHSIDRINNDAGYEPSNCRWATHLEQLLNRRNTLYVEFQGQRKTLVEWAKVFNMPYNRLVFRLRRGWTVPDLFLPKQRRKRCLS